MTPRVLILRYSQIARCPILSLSPEHYRDDGTCKCNPTPAPKEPTP